MAITASKGVLRAELEDSEDWAWEAWAWRFSDEAEAPRRSAVVEIRPLAVFVIVEVADWIWEAE